MAAVCFIVWALRPAWRTVGATTAVLSVVSVGSTFQSRMSGHALMKLQGISEENPGDRAPHLLYANLLTGSVIAMAVLAVALWFMDRTGLRVLGVLAAVAVIITCVPTGA